MIRVALFSIHGTQDVLEIIERTVCDQAISCSIKYGILKITIQESCPGYQYILNKIKKENLKADYNEFRTYSKEEVEKALFYKISISDPWELDGKSEKDFNSDYDLASACPKCGAGKALKSIIQVPIGRLKKKEFALLVPSIIVSARVKKLITENHISGCDFLPVIDYKTKTTTEFFQMQITSIMPPLDDSVKVTRVPGWYCSNCNNTGKVLNSELIYKKADLNDMKDFNLTRECFGISSSMRDIIVSQRVRNLFKEEKIKVIYYEPISIIESSSKREDILPEAADVGEIEKINKDIFCKAKFGKDLKNLLDYEKVIYYCQDLTMSIHSNGFENFFYNGYGEDFDQYLRALTILGIDEGVAILREAAKRFPNGMPKDNLEYPDVDIDFDDLDAEFMEIDTNTPCVMYLKEHSI